MNVSSPNPNPRKRATAEERRQRLAEILKLRFDEDLSIQAIAERLQLSVGQVCNDLRVVEGQIRKETEPRTLQDMLEERLLNYQKLEKDAQKMVDEATDLKQKLASMKLLLHAMDRKEKFFERVGMMGVLAGEIRVKYNTLNEANFLTNANPLNIADCQIQN